MKFPLSRLLLGLILIGCLVAGPLQAQTQPKGRITSLKINGLELIDKGTVYGTIQSRIGGEITSPQVAEDIRKLYELGYFQDVTVKYEETKRGEFTLIYEFIEKPRIRNFDIKGAYNLSEKKYGEELRVFEKNMLNLNLVKQDILMLNDKYREKGYYNTTIDYIITPVSPGWVDLTYQVKEKKTVYLTEIKVTGTKFFYPLDIERQMQSAEVDCFNWINGSGVYMEEKINADLQIISQNYMREGFIRVRIGKPKITLIKSRDIQKITVEFDIKEGDRYFVKSMDIASEDGYPLLFDKDEKIKEFKLKPGDPYDPFKEQQDQYSVNSEYLEQGYAFAKVRSRQNINEETKQVDSVFLVTRKHKAYIGRVEVSGNYETQDYVLRRELEIHDNELFNGTKLRESHVNINRLGYFEPQTGISFNQKRGENKNEINYDIQLHEAQTGTFSANMSYSAFSGVAVQFKLTKKNFYGTGKTLSFSVQKEQRGDSIFDFSMINPYFFDTKATNTINLFNVYTPDDQYDTRATGYKLGFSYPLWKHLYGSMRYSWKRETYESISTIGEEALQGAEFNHYRSMKFGISYNTVDNPMFPTEGGETTLSTERFGGPFGGTIDYQVANFTMSRFGNFNEAKTIVGMARFRTGVLMKTDPDQEIPLHQRFRMGGMTSIRGHEWRALQGASSPYEGDPFYIADQYPYQGDYSDCEDSPECLALDEEKHEDRKYWERHVGGNLYRTLNLEMLFPLTREGQNVRGVIFYDIGNVWSEDRMYEIRGLEKDLNLVRRSAGLGIRFITPMGVIRFEYGAKLDKHPRESPSKFEFNISGLF